jgi:tetratricopeptide (TPR) repeat protein
VQAKADRDRAARTAWAEASVAAAVREARERADEAWGVTDYPDRMQRATDAAVAAVRRADDYAAGGPPGEAARAELESTRRAVDEVARHTRLITTQAASSERFADQLGQNTFLDSYNRLGEPLRQFGLDPIDGPADEVARAVADSRIRDSLLGVLLEWHHKVHSLAVPLRQDPGRTDLPADAPVISDRLERVIRSARQLSGGAYARWQGLLDRHDVPGLVAFAASPDGLSFRSTLVGAMGRDLVQAKQYPACWDYLRAAVERYPHDAWLHADLAQACKNAQPPDFAEALRHHSVASAQRPNSAWFLLMIAYDYAGLGSYDRAIAAYRKVIALSCFYAGLASLDFSRALAGAGRHAEARQAMLDSQRRDPARAQDPRTYLRYNAACCAMNCADGKDIEVPAPAERVAYRKQALDLLAVDLAAIRKLTVTDGAFVHQHMAHWLGDKDLASVREPAALERLSPDERAAWQKLWSDVRALRDATASPTGPVKPDP